MDYRVDLLKKVFDLVGSRLKERGDSLCRYLERWHGSAGGIEGWFKVEFVASVPKNLATVLTGSAATPKTSGKKFPDLRLKVNHLRPVDIELKASTNWSPFHSKNPEYYHGRAIFFLCGAPADSLEAKRHALAKTWRHLNVIRVCGAVQCTDNCDTDFYSELSTNCRRPIASKVGRRKFGLISSLAVGSSPTLLRRDGFETAQICVWENYDFESSKARFHS
jgi:hypothetical protein